MGTLAAWASLKAQLTSPVPWNFIVHAKSWTTAGDLNLRLSQPRISVPKSSTPPRKHPWYTKNS